MSAPDKNSETPAEQSAAQPHFHEGLLDLVSELVFSLDPNTFTLIYINDAAEKIYGRSLDELSGNRLWLQMIHHDDQIVLCEQLETLSDSDSPIKEFEHEFRIVRADSTQSFLPVSYTHLTLPTKA